MDEKNIKTTNGSYTRTHTMLLSYQNQITTSLLSLYLKWYDKILFSHSIMCIDWKVFDTKLTHMYNLHIFISFFFFSHYINTGGKPITPNDVTDSLTNGHTENGGVSESVTKSEVSIDPNT